MKTIAFVGNPNVGKSAWINALSNANFVIGNWPGVTIEQKKAEVTWDDQSYCLIDLPGTYSLDLNHNEESITANYLNHEAVDCIVNVVDATNLQRNLYLTLLLRELQIPMILLLNFMDEANRYHIVIDTVKLSRRLQVPIVCASAHDPTTYETVKDFVIQTTSKSVFYYPLLLDRDYDAYVEMFQYFQSHIPSYHQLSDLELTYFIKRYQQGDPSAHKQADLWNLDPDMCKQLLIPFQGDEMNKKRYGVIQSLMKYVHEDEELRFKQTRKIDYYLLHRVWGIPIFLVIFGVLLLLVFKGSAPWIDFIDYIIHDYLSKYVWLLLENTHPILQEFIVNGIIAGVGGVLVFIPLMAYLYAMLALLEESGYMARIAFLLDRLMRHFHLSGKSFVSLLIGFGCNVPAIYATRTLDNQQQRRLSAILIPFMSCGARLPVYVLFAAAFFDRRAGQMIISVYAIGILVALLLALICSRFPMFQNQDLFILELPPYRKPKPSIVYQKIKKEVIAYVKKATNVVLWAMMIIWAFSYFPSGNIESSYIATLGKVASPLYEPLGFGTRWECVASLPGSIVAKETVVGFFNQVLTPTTLNHEDQWDLKTDTHQLLITFKDTVKQGIFIFDKQEEVKQNPTFITAVASLWDDPLQKLRAFSFMVYVLLMIPCIMTLHALYREYGVRQLLLSMILMSVIPYVVCFCLFQGFRLLFAFL